VPEGITGVLPGLARRQGISDMLHRTASRVPGKLAIVSGATRLTFAELEAAVSRTAAAGRGVIEHTAAVRLGLVVLAPGRRTARKRNPLRAAHI
jgi:non-ribosomal peptide synthetase component F